jgi:chemotaxis protein CheX
MEGAIMVGQEIFAEALLAGMTEVFETMMFMSVEECNEMYEAIEGDALLSTITFKGLIDGCLGVSCNVNCAKNIARNMLGMDAGEEVGQEEIADTMGEVANMVLGSVKARLMDAVGDVQVSIPTVVTGKELVNSLGDGSHEVSKMVHIDEDVARLTLLYRFTSEAN